MVMNEPFYKGFSFDSEIIPLCLYFFQVSQMECVDDDDRGTAFNYFTARGRMGVIVWKGRGSVVIRIRRPRRTNSSQEIQNGGRTFGLELMPWDLG